MRVGTLYKQTDCTAEDAIWEKVYETTLGTASSSISITSLSGDTDKEYRLIMKMVDDSTVGNINLQFNSDTGSNYGRQYMQGYNGNNVAGSRTTGASVIYIGDSGYDTRIGSLEQLIYAESGEVRLTIGNYLANVTGTTVYAVALVGGRWSNTGDEMTSMQISTSEDNFDTGTYLALYRKVASA